MAVSAERVVRAEVAGVPAAAMQAHAQDAARWLRALANPHRLMILCCLGEGELCVGDLNAHIPLAQSALSQHLAVLRRDGFVVTRRESQTIYYSIRSGPTFEVLSVLYRHFCSAQN